MLLAPVGMCIWYANRLVASIRELRGAAQKISNGNLGVEVGVDPACGFFFFKQKTAYEIGLGIPAEPLFRSSFAASWLLNALLRIFAMSIITPKRKVLRMSVQDCWRPPL